MIKSTFYRSSEEEVEKRKYKINGFNLPNTMDIRTWGDSETSDDKKQKKTKKQKMP
jgi:hypothetical protein